MSTSPLMTVSGIRGIVDESLTADFIARVAFVQTRLAGAQTVVVGRDTRPSGAALSRAVFRGIRAAGAEPVDLGIAPTPTTCVATAHLGAGAGVIITASHNPLPYNGYKMVHGSGRLYNDTECRAVYDRLDSVSAQDLERIGKADDNPSRTFNAAPVHIERILGAVDVDLVRAASISVAIDATNGAAAAVFPRLLDALGVQWLGVHVALDGNFVHNPEPRPEHLTDLAALLRETPDVWGGFAFDPDADRLAPMAENGDGISEEMTLALALENLLARGSRTVVTNLSTSMVIDDVARAHGATVTRTAIGEANVVAGMLSAGDAVGGEGNGGVIFPAVSTVRDGLTGLALIVESMARSRQTLSRLAARWTQYPLLKRKIALGDEPPAAVIERLAARFASENIDTQDGLKIIREHGWVHIRPSNTEPILRCYAEAKTQDEAEALAAMIAEEV
ncbi:MAG: phosphoglucosamine mutase [Chitinivibrionales bacterium]|nr:phosphoglucosamine mutase [Chitinivibrionales bacterium]